MSYRRCGKDAQSRLVNRLFLKTALLLLTLTTCILLAEKDGSAQTLYGSIVGTVTDTSGSVVPGASVKAVQTATNETRTAATNDAGIYSLSTVPAGTYVVTVTKSGFKVFEADNVVVSINATARVDAALAVGAATQTVTVSGQTAQLETDRVDVHSDISSTQLQELPQPTRTYEGLLGLLPGVAPPSPNFAGSGGTNNPNRSMVINVNGTSASGTAVSVDGVSALNPWVQFYSTAVPSTDAIETVNTVTASSGADQGIMNGAGIRVQIKGGTNAFHGSFYGYHVNSAMKATPYFEPSNYRKPKYIDNDDGVTIGGPIKRDKLFFFGSYEGDFLRQASGSFYTLPTPLMTQGVLASPTPIYDPSTGNADGTGRQPFPQDAAGRYIIDPSRISPAAAILAQNVPAGVPEGVYSNNVYINSPNSYNLQKIDTRFDWDATSKLRITGRYSTYPYKQHQSPAFGQILGSGGANIDQHGNTYTIAGLVTYVASPNLVIDGVVGVTHSTQYLFPSLYNTRYGAETLKIPGTNLGPLPSAGGVPQFNFNGLNGWGYNYPALTYADPVFQYSGNVNWVKKTHSFRFGMEISQQHMNHQEVTPTSFSFSGGATSLNAPNAPAPNQFNSFADFLLGLPTSASNSVLTSNWVTLRTWQFAPYFSDTWQATRKLTVYIGTGWNYLPVPSRDGRGIEYYDSSTNVYQLCGYGTVSGNCGITVQKDLFAPRIGFAYRLKPNTIVRTGYSLAPEQINMARDGLYNYPATLTQNFNGATSYTPTTTLSQGLPDVALPDLGSGSIILPPTLSSATPAKHFIRGYTESYNLTVQQELKWNLLAQVGYVGTLTIHQHTRENINYGFVGGGQASQVLYAKFGVTGSRIEILPLEHMNYQSLQAQIQKRFSNGLQFMSSYTFSKWLGLCCDEQGDGNPQILIPQFFRKNWALMPDDRKHNFQLSAVYLLPFGKGQKYANTGIPSLLAGGWQTNGVLSRYSGTPFTISAPGTSLNAPGNNQVADQVKPHVAIYGYHGLNSRYFDTSAFAPVTAVRFGTAGFNSVRGPGYINLDFSLFRTFPIKDSLKMQFRAEALNAFNHPNFSNPDGGVTDSGFGVINGINPGSRLIAERFFRLGLKFTY